MRVILYLCIFVKIDTLEIEFSSFETTPDMAQGFIKLELRSSKTSLRE